MTRWFYDSILRYNAHGIVNVYFSAELKKKIYKIKKNNYYNNNDGLHHTDIL